MGPELQNVLWQCNKILIGLCLNKAGCFANNFCLVLKCNSIHLSRAFTYDHAISMCILLSRVSCNAVTLASLGNVFFKRRHITI